MSKMACGLELRRPIITFGWLEIVHADDSNDYGWPLAHLPMRFQAGLPVIHELTYRVDKILVLFGAVDGGMDYGMQRVGLMAGGHGPLQGIGTVG